MWLWPVVCCFACVSIMLTTTCSLSVTPSDISQCSDVQLTCLAAEALHLHLSSRHLVTSGTKAVMAKLLHDALQHKIALSPILWWISNCHLNYDRHFNCNCYFYFQCLYLNDPVSEPARECATCTPSSIVVVNGSISSTCYIDCESWFDDPVNETTCHLATCASGAAIYSDSLIPAAGCTTNKATRTINSVSPALLIMTHTLDRTIT